MKLYDLLLEVAKGPKAVILAGAPGAGKSTVVGDALKGKDLTILNIDDIYVPLLKQRGVSLDMKNHTPEERSTQAATMWDAKKEYEEKVSSAIANKENVVIDGTAASKKATLELVDGLKEAGYDVMMLYVYVSLEQSLARNEKRFEKSGGEDRSLPPAIVLSTWSSVTSNFDDYADYFGDRFVAVNNAGDEALTTKSVEDLLDKYVTPFAPKNTKPQTDAQKAAKAKRKAKDREKIANFMKQDNVQKFIEKSVSPEEAQRTLTQFLS